MRRAGKIEGALCLGCVEPGERRHQADAQCRLCAGVWSSVTTRILVSFGKRRVVVARERASGGRRVRYRFRAVAWCGIHFFGDFPIFVSPLGMRGGQRIHVKSAVSGFLIDIACSKFSLVFSIGSFARFKITWRDIYVRAPWRARGWVKPRSSHTASQVTATFLILCPRRHDRASCTTREH